MKKMFLSLALASLTSVVFAQAENPVKWTFTAKKIDNTTYEVHLTAKVEDGWHIYSQSTPDGGPTATSIAFVRNPLITLEGPAKEVGKLEEHFEPLFGVEVRQFSGKVNFVQTVKIKPGAKTSIRGSVTFMTCNDESCIPARAEDFTLTTQ
jgi:DsbC/DsbD-like thiol-disulfide interchange protein